MVLPILHHLRRPTPQTGQALLKRHFRGIVVAEALPEARPRSSPLLRIRPLVPLMVSAAASVDSSAPMLELASRRCAAQAVVELRLGEVVSLPVDDDSFDAALCVQVLEYVADPSVALAEMHRALRPGGHVVVWDVDWATVSLHALDTALTKGVLRAWDQHLTHPSLPSHARGADPAIAAGFEQVRMQAHPFTTCELDPETYGAAMLPFIGDVRRGTRRDHR